MKSNWVVMFLSLSLSTVAFANCISDLTQEISRANRGISQTKEEFGDAFDIKDNLVAGKAVRSWCRIAGGCSRFDFQAVMTTTGLPLMPVAIPMDLSISSLKSTSLSSEDYIKNSELKKLRNLFVQSKMLNGTELHSLTQDLRDEGFAYSREQISEIVLDINEHGLFDIRERTKNRFVNCPRNIEEVKQFIIDRSVVSSH